MRISTLFTALTTVVLAGLLMNFGERTVFAQLGGLGGRALATEPVSIKQGQTARLEVANTSNESLIVWLFFRDSEGKVLVQKQVAIKSGAKESLEYSFTGPNNPLNPDNNLKVQLPGQEPPRVLTALVREDFKADSSTHPNPGNKPTLYIISDMQTVRQIGAEGFKDVSRQTDFPDAPNVGEHPPLKSAELRPGNDPRSYVTSEVFMLERGQVARLELKSTGNESVAAQLQFVDEQGKVLIQRNATIRPSGNELLEFGGAGGPDWRGGFRAQFATAFPNGTGSLQPQLRILDKRKGDTIIIGRERFRQINPTDSRGYVPKAILAPQSQKGQTELRPENDPAPPKGPAEQVFPTGSEHAPLKTAKPRPGNDPRSFVTAEAYMLERGQVAQLELKNTGSESVAVRLRLGNDPTPAPETDH